MDLNTYTYIHIYIYIFNADFKTLVAFDGLISLSNVIFLISIPAQLVKHGHDFKSVFLFFFPTNNSNGKVGFSLEVLGLVFV